MMTPSRSYSRKYFLSAVFAVTVVTLMARRILTQQSAFITQYRDEDIASAASKAIAKSQFSEEHKTMNNPKNATRIEQDMAKKVGIRRQRYRNGTVDYISKKIENDKNVQAIETSDGELVLPNVLLIGVQKAGTTAVSISW